jgi:hypothetical protein
MTGGASPYSKPFKCTHSCVYTPEYVMIIRVYIRAYIPDYAMHLIDAAIVEAQRHRHIYSWTVNFFLSNNEIKWRPVLSKEEQL